MTGSAAARRWSRRQRRSYDSSSDEESADGRLSTIMEESSLDLRHCSGSVSSNDDIERRNQPLIATKSKKEKNIRDYHSWKKQQQILPTEIEVDDQDATFESHVDETVTEEQHQKAAVGAWGLMFHYDDEYADNSTDDDSGLSSDSSFSDDGLSGSPADRYTPQKPTFRASPQTIGTQGDYTYITSQNSQGSIDEIDSDSDWDESSKEEENCDTPNPLQEEPERVVPQNLSLQKENGDTIENSEQLIIDTRVSEKRREEQKEDEKVEVLDDTKPTPPVHAEKEIPLILDLTPRKRTNPFIGLMGMCTSKQEGDTDSEDYETSLADAESKVNSLLEQLQSPVCSHVDPILVGQVIGCLDFSTLDIENLIDEEQMITI